MATRSFNTVGAAVALAGALLAGCASGPKFSEISGSIPAIPADDGRIYFFRSSSMMGAALQPDIRLNGQVLGTSKPGGFFYVDRPAGSYTAAASTEVEKTTAFMLAAGETTYVRTSPGFGVIVGHINFEIEDPAKARAEIETLSLTGPAGGGPAVSSSKARATPSPSPGTAAVGPQADAAGRPAHTRHLDAALLEGRTWTFPHPRDPQRFGNVRITFANGTASASNAVSASSGPYTVVDDEVCIDLRSASWGHPCYYVYDSEAADSVTPAIYAVGTRRSAPLTIR